MLHVYCLLIVLCLDVSRYHLSCFNLFAYTFELSYMNMAAPFMSWLYQTSCRKGKSYMPDFKHVNINLHFLN